MVGSSCRYIERQREHQQARSEYSAACVQDGGDANGSSQSQLVADCLPGEASASEASASDAYSMFALSLDNDSCRSPELLGATPPATERPKRNLYMPEQRPLIHFQVGRSLSHCTDVCIHDTTIFDFLPIIEARLGVMSCPEFCIM